MKRAGLGGYLMGNVKRWVRVYDFTSKLDLRRFGDIYIPYFGMIPGLSG